MKFTYESKNVFRRLLLSLLKYIFVIIPDLSTGKHRLIVYAKDQFGNTGVSETVVFEIKPFPSFLVIISISLVGFIGLSLLIHATRQKKGKED